MLLIFSNILGVTFFREIDYNYSRYAIYKEVTQWS